MPRSGGRLATPARVGRVRGLSVALIALVSLACTAHPTASTAASSSGAAPVSADTAVPSPTPASHGFVAEADGYTLTVVPDRLELAPGETVTFMATFRNGTDKPIDVAGGCGGDSSGFVSVPLPVMGQGRTWTGVRQDFKDYVLANALGPGGPSAFDPVVVSLTGPGCSDSTMSSELGPGDSMVDSLGWKAQIVGGVDPLVGTIPFTVSVGYDQQNGPPSYPPDYTGPMISWSPLFKQLSVTGELQVDRQGKALKSAAEVIDGALADATFAAWLGKRPATTWSGTNLFLVSSPNGAGILPKGPAWELDLFRERGVPRNWAIVFVDPFDASFISATYCDVPCDR